MFLLATNVTFRCYGSFYCVRVSTLAIPTGSPCFSLPQSKGLEAERALRHVGHQRSPAPALQDVAA